jgi:hypothetical protein
MPWRSGARGERRGHRSWRAGAISARAEVRADAFFPAFPSKKPVFQGSQLQAIPQAREPRDRNVVGWNLFLQLALESLDLFGKRRVVADQMLNFANGV